jgi:heme/copper-type cytochrome/quinol oxidase subunit 2
MFTSGQKIFALLFFIAFVILMIYSYRKDIKLHKIHYKNTFLILAAVIAIFILFGVITFSMH